MEQPKVMEDLFGSSDDEEGDAGFGIEEVSAEREEDEKKSSHDEEDPEPSGPLIDDLFSDDDDEIEGNGSASASKETEDGAESTVITSASLNKDLFGDDDEDDEDDDDEQPDEKKDQHQSQQREDSDRYADLDLDLDDEGASSQRAPRPTDEGRNEDQLIDYTRLPRPPGPSSMFYVKLPNILGLEQRPFERDTFEAADEDELVEGPEGQKMKPLPPESIMRWRIVTDKYGRERRESNARFVRWSNGTVQLLLGGNEEVLGVDTQDINKDNFHVFATQKGSIQAHGRLHNKLIFTPSTLHSKSHQKLTMHLVKQSKQNARRVKLVSISKIDPEVEKRRKEAAEQERIKHNQRKKEMSYKNYGLTANMLEEGESGPEDEVDERRILDAKHSSPVRKRSRDAPARRRQSGSSGRKAKDDFIDDDDLGDSGEGSDVNVEEDWETKGSSRGGGGVSDDDDDDDDSDDSNRKRRRSSSSSSRRSSGGRSDSD